MLVLPLWILAGLVPVSVAFNCSVPPIYVDIHNRVVHGTNIFQWGSFMGVGSPDQNQSLVPSLRQNETSVAWIDYCQDSGLPNCLEATGGNFDPTQSKSWAKLDDYQTWDSSPVGNKSMYGTDRLHLFTHFIETDPASQTVMKNFPFEVARTGDVNPGVVGVGSSSTLLQELFNHGLIAGRTYSLFVGTGMERMGGVFNGSNTFGGYDQGRFKGEIHNYAMDPSHPLALNVSVTDIVISQDGEDQSLLDGSRFPNMQGAKKHFPARITTDQFPMRFPPALTDNFAELLHAEESDHPDGSLQLKKPFSGTMSITLSDGFTVTMPSEVVYNASGLAPVAAKGAKQDDEDDEDFLLSLAWLMQVYLMIDYDSWTFHLAEAIQDHEFVTLQTLCPKGTPIPYDPPETSAFTSEGLAGAVVGGVVGGLGVIALSVWLFVLFMRRRYTKAEENAEMNMLEAKKLGGYTQFDFGEGVSRKSTGMSGMGTGRTHSGWYGGR